MFGGRAGLDPAVISAKLILILQRGLIFPMCFLFSAEGRYLSCVKVFRYLGPSPTEGN